MVTARRQSGSEPACGYPSVRHVISYSLKCTAAYPNLAEMAGGVRIETAGAGQERSSAKWCLNWVEKDSRRSWPFTAVASEGGPITPEGRVSTHTQCGEARAMLDVILFRYLIG